MIKELTGYTSKLSNFTETKWATKLIERERERERWGGGEMSTLSAFTLKRWIVIICCWQCNMRVILRVSKPLLAWSSIMLGWWRLPTRQERKEMAGTSAIQIGLCWWLAASIGSGQSQTGVYIFGIFISLDPLESIYVSTGKCPYWHEDSVPLHSRTQVSETAESSRLRRGISSSFILILPSRSCLDQFQSYCSSKILCAFTIFLIRATAITHVNLILLDLVASEEKYKLRNSLLCNFLHSLTHSVQNILVKIFLYSSWRSLPKHVQYYISLIYI
jgi:hypothetical protein